TDLLEFYQNKSTSIFTSKSWNLFATTKYTDEGRSLIFNDYFWKTPIKSSTRRSSYSCSEKDTMQSHLFTCYNSNDTLYGGVDINNPASVAYSEVFESGETRKVTMLSLGTDNYIPDPLRPDMYCVSLEKPVELDDCKSIFYLLESGHQYIGELDASDENSLMYW
ncbi:9948_t:CDS:2, partial [Gigaspora margarita]